MRPLNDRERSEDQSYNAWRIIDNSIVLDAFNPTQSNGNGSKAHSYISNVYSNIVSSNSSKAYTFSKIKFLCLIFIFR